MLRRATALKRICDRQRVQNALCPLREKIGTLDLKIKGTMKGTY